MRASGPTPWMVRMKIAAAARTMEGPAGASVIHAAAMPMGAATAPIRLAASAMPSGVRANGRAAAGGISKQRHDQKRADDLQPESDKPATNMRKARS